MMIQAVSSSLTKQVCAICRADDAPNDLVQTVCQHIFHQNCLETWLKIKNICPLCRRDFSNDELFETITFVFTILFFAKVVK